MIKKNSFLVLISLCIVSLFGCKEATQPRTALNKNHTTHYIAISGNDTAWLKLDTSDKEILGELVFNYHNQNRFVGTVKAVMKGDTLLGGYSFKLNGVDKWYRNPIALLKKDDRYTMGVGQIMSLWGASYFEKNVPIDYEKGRFVFEEVDFE